MMEPSIKLTSEHRQSIEQFRSQHKTGLLALLFTDIVGSTALKQQLGDTAGNALIAEHNEVVRNLLEDFPDGAEISTAGDSFFIAFVRPSDAVRFSLMLYAHLREMSKETVKPVTIRIGIHMGEVHIIQDAQEEGMRDILGLQVDIAARIMSLGQGGQSLMSRGVFDNARSVLKSEDIPAIKSISWLNHGPYTLKGVEEPQDIAEVGEKEFAPLSAPSDSEKAKSIAPIDGNLVVGWRPSPVTEIPSAPGWIALEKLGEGGFGEVWKAQKTKETDDDSPATEMEALQGLPIGTTVAFKFCFDIAHARALKREATLFKLLQKKQGELKHTVKFIDYQLAEAPLFLAMEFIQGKNLSQWLKEEGAAIKPVRRLQMMAPVAQAIHDIHESGVIINDIKPSNILVRYKDDGTQEFLLTDLGIGQIRDKKFLEEADHTRTTGFTKTSLTMASGSSGAQGGSLLYLAPELLEGEKPSVASDVYAFGVTLMQVAVGNPKLALSTKRRKRMRPRLSRHLVARLTQEEAKNREQNFRKVSKKLKNLPRRVMFRAISMRVAGTLFLSLFLFLCYQVSITPKMFLSALKEEKRVSALGLATSIGRFNTKHRANYENERSLFEELDNILRGIIDRPPSRSSLASGYHLTHLGTIPYSLEETPSREDIERLFNTKHSISDPDDAEKIMYVQRLNSQQSLLGRRHAKDLEKMLQLQSRLNNHLEKTRTFSVEYFKISNYKLRSSGKKKGIRDTLSSFANTVPYRRLNYHRSFDQPSPFPIRVRRVNDSEMSIHPFLYLFEYLWPSRIHSLFEENSISEIEKTIENVYGSVLDGLFLIKVYKAQIPSLAEENIASICELNMICCLQALMETIPPSREISIKLYDILDPREIQREYIRSLEADLSIHGYSILQWADGYSNLSPETLLNRASSYGIYGSLDRIPSFFRKPLSAKIYESQIDLLRSLDLASKNLEVRRSTEQQHLAKGKLLSKSYESIFLSPLMPEALFSSKHKRLVLSKASLLRAALLLHIAGLDAKADFSKMPTALAPLFDAQGDPPPLDYLGETLESQIEYVPNPKDGIYMLRHSAPSPDEKPFEFLGQWIDEEAIRAYEALVYMSMSGVSDGSEANNLFHLWDKYLQEHGKVQYNLPQARQRHAMYKILPDKFQILGKLNLPGVELKDVSFREAILQDEDGISALAVKARNMIGGTLGIMLTGKSSNMPAQVKTALKNHTISKGEEGEIRFMDGMSEDIVHYWNPQKTERANWDFRLLLRFDDMSQEKSSR